MQLSLIATCAFGLEAIVVRELAGLGYEARVVRPGRIAFAGQPADLCRACLWLRCADRLLVELARFEAHDFDALYDTVQTIPWEEWVDPHAALLVRGRSHKSQLTSVPAIQRTTKKALVERLLRSPGIAELPESGPAAPIEVSLVENVASIDLDASGAGLHRRGYRTLSAPAQLRETLASALVQLSFWEPERPLIDPFCGSGTILIEAAQLGRRMAPGRKREFAAEHWRGSDADDWQRAREEARDLQLAALPERILGSDRDAEVLKLARYHAEQADVSQDLHLQQREFADLSSKRRHGCVITNPPYGQRMGSDEEIERLYRSFPEVLRRLPTWSHFILSARSDLEQLVGQPAARRRKLYNGRIACTYFQFHGPRPGSAPSGPSSERVFGGLREEAQRQADEFANRLRNRARHLRRWPTKRQITCYRLYERDIPEIPLVVDRYDDALHIAEFERPHDRTPGEHADWLDLMVRTAAQTLEIQREAVFVKFRSRQRGANQYGRVADMHATRVVTEGGLRFRVNLSDYIDTGLFLDHRITRGLVRDAARGKRLLNLFAYTGTFTVYAIDGGATETTTVDLSSTYLDWTAENLALNEMAVNSAHRLIRDDAVSFLADLPAEPLFDLAVVDPPTFSNSKRTSEDWEVQRDHGRLLTEVLRRMSQEGEVYFSTNDRRFKLDETALSGHRVREISRQTVPEDFRNQRIHRCWHIRRGKGSGT